jgi:NADH:ubiquinone oxidoreductase subunit 3 (subunit A)
MENTSALDLLLSPPAAVAAFTLLVYGLYRLGGALSAPGHDHPGKHQPYACGEDLAPTGARLTYHVFYRLALMFGILHLATLVMATLPGGGVVHRVALVYLGGIAISVVVLTQGEDDA